MDVKKYLIEAMFLDSPKSIIKEEESEKPVTNAWNLSLLSEPEPPSFFLAPSGIEILFFSNVCDVMFMVLFMHALYVCQHF